MIIAIKHKEQVKVVFDASELNVIGLSQADLKREANLPYWRAENTNDIYVFSNMSTFCGDLFRYQPIIKAPLTLKSLQIETVAALIEVFKEFKCLSDKGVFENDILVVSPTSIYTIDQFRLVTKHHDFCVLDYHRTFIEEVLKVTSNEPFDQQINSVIDYRSSYINRTLGPYFIFDVQSGTLNQLHSEKEKHLFHSD